MLVAWRMQLQFFTLLCKILLGRVNARYANLSFFLDFENYFFFFIAKTQTSEADSTNNCIFSPTHLHTVAQTSRAYPLDFKHPKVLSFRLRPDDC